MSNKKTITYCQDSASGLYSSSKKNIVQEVKPVVNNNSIKNDKNDKKQN
ncbi:hypothetical protein [Aliarcobacter skirrowii]|jgi:hypothetical protein|nr:hypothetical protein [Aliarcobacter skirrowii]MDY0180725.1 hypothetical protein [Aliarcobacter skirrowii]